MSQQWEHVLSGQLVMTRPVVTRTLGLTMEILDDSAVTRSLGQAMEVPDC